MVLINPVENHMKNKNFIQSLFFFSLLALPLTAVQAREKIVGGEKVTDPTEAPYIVSLSGVCGGSVISSKWVLTAAHCAGHFSEVKGGILNLKEQGVSVRVKKVIKHPDYNASTFSNDFALVELEKEIDFKNTTITPVRLASPVYESHGGMDPGIDATVYGFGNLSSWRPNSTKDLNKVIVPIVSHEEANAPASYNGKIDDTMLPAGYAAGGKDSCQGDSGGPMVVFNHRNQPVQVGVVSWGQGCASPNKYGIYSKVSSAYLWIMKTAK
jgi:trypsin